MSSESQEASALRNARSNRGSAAIVAHPLAVCDKTSFCELVSNASDALTRCIIVR